MKPVLDINDFVYTLPQEKIALFPLKERDQSKLLVYNNGIIRHEHFFQLADFLPERSLLFLNNTKVIQARILFTKDTGAEIEVFLLSPVSPSPLLLEAMQAVGKCRWKCTIGNMKRWRSGSRLEKTLHDGLLISSLVDREQGIVDFEWNSGKTFAEIVAEIGNTPLPPYLRREATQEDRDRYQTIYSVAEGAVAAPTAGLHFTPRVFESIERKGCRVAYVTLHVSAGTFQPIKVRNAAEHVMHQEQVIITRDAIVQILEGRIVIPVGTTSMRTLESLYWFGVKLANDKNTPFTITQDDAFTLPQNMTVEQSLKNVVQYMDVENREEVIGETSIYIVPGYKFRICDGLITNFHQPASTLILLIAALVGDNWREIYEEALQKNYRFLSYGDSSLLLPQKKEG